MHAQSALGAAFKRPFGNNLIIGIVMVPMVALALGLGFVIARGYGMLRAAHAHAEPGLLAGFPSGKVRLAGTALRPAGNVRAPSGAEGIAWVGTAGVMKKVKRGYDFDPQCELGNVSGLLVNSGTTTTRIELVPEGKELVQAHHDQLGEPVPLVDFGPPKEMTGDKVPASVMEKCAGRLTDPAVVYREAVLPNLQQVEILGCVDGSALVPCGDRVDTITTGSLAARIKNTKDKNGFTLVFGGLWNLSLSAILGAMLASALVRVRLSAGDRRRA